MEFDKIIGQRLGRQPTSTAMRERNFHLDHYLAVLPPPPPTPINVNESITTWPMFLNDHLGDCACAAPAHMEMIFARATGSTATPTDADVLALYELQGYNPNDPSTDNGSSMGHVLHNWRNGDWAASQIYAYCAVDTSNEQQLQLALWLFRGLYVGVGLPKTAQGQAVWDIVPDTPDRNAPWSWGGHAVNLVAINTDGSREFISWGQQMKMTKAFWDTYVDECYAVVTADLKDGQTLQSNGFNVQQLEADLAQLGSS